MKELDAITGPSEIAPNYRQLPRGFSRLGASYRVGRVEGLLPAGFHRTPLGNMG
jgi:hypothetical protein